MTSLALLAPLGPLPRLTLAGQVALACLWRPENRVFFGLSSLNGCFSTGSGDFGLDYPADGTSTSATPRTLVHVTRPRSQNEIILSSLRSSGKVAVVASEQNDLPVWMCNGGPYVVVTYPLDGSRNIEVSIPIGTIFGIYNRLVELNHPSVEERAQLNSLQSGTRMVAAGYVLYSSATILCISFGSGTHGFTLDLSTGEFILTHPSVQIPLEAYGGAPSRRRDSRSSRSRRQAC